MIQQKLLRFWKEEDGIGTLEILLIIAVIVIIAIAFRKWIMKWVKQLFEGADSEIKSQNMDSDDLLPASTP
jgi:Flp pilus assembly pilin Flp